MKAYSATRKRRFGRRRFQFALLLLLALLLAMTGWIILRPHLSHAYVMPVARFHVVPNSDSVDDQQLKLAVRDALLPVVERVLSADKDRTRAIRTLIAGSDTLRRVAKAELRRLNASYPVSIETEVDGAGDPLALKVVIGAGRGSNWFCVLVPPLCFADVEPVEKVPIESEDDIKGGRVRFAWKWLDKWFGTSNVSLEGIGDVDQDDVHANFAHAVPRDGDVGSAAEETK